RQADALATDEPAVGRTLRRDVLFLVLDRLAAAGPPLGAGQALAFAANQTAVVRADRARLDRLALAGRPLCAFVADAFAVLDMAVRRALRPRLGAFPPVPDETLLAATAARHHPVDGTLRQRLFLL